MHPQPITLTHNPNLVALTGIAKLEDLNKRIGQVVALLQKLN